MRGWGSGWWKSTSRPIFLKCTLICSLLWKGCSRKNLLRVLWGGVGVSIGMDAQKDLPVGMGGVSRVWDPMTGRYDGTIRGCPGQAERYGEGELGGAGCPEGVGCWS